MNSKHPVIRKRIEVFEQKGWWGNKTLNDMFREALRSAPDQLALMDQPNKSEILEGEAQRFTWKELDQEVGFYAAALQELGLSKGDILLTQLPNVSELVVLFLAASRLGVIISPVPVQYGRHEIELIANQLSPALFIGATHSGEHDLTGGVVDVEVGKRAWLGTGGPAKDASLDSILRALKNNDARVADDQMNDANGVFTICWTSGTSGAPKGVPRTHNQWIAIAQATYDAAELLEGDVLLNPFPFVNMASIGGFLYNWIRSYSAMALHHPLDLPVYLTQIQQEKVTFTIAPPALLNMLLKNDELMSNFDISSLRCIASGSAPLSPWMVRGFAEKYDIGVVNLFGSNEGCSIVSSLADIPDPEQRATYFPRFGVEGLEWKASVSKMMKTRLRDIAIGELITEKGRPGELEIFGATLFDHYLGQQPDDPEVFTEDGYFRTGDLFEIQGDQQPAQFYKFVGRSKDVIIRGGFKISPDELDIALAAHSMITEAATVSYPCEDLGERICVFLVLKENESVTLDDIRDYLKSLGFASFKLPERIEVTDALPRNALDKVVRKKLKEKL